MGGEGSGEVVEGSSLGVVASDNGVGWRDANEQLISIDFCFIMNPLWHAVPIRQSHMLWEPRYIEVDALCDKPHMPSISPHMPRVTKGIRHLQQWNTMHVQLLQLRQTAQIAQNRARQQRVAVKVQPLSSDRSPRSLGIVPNSNGLLERCSTCSSDRSLSSLMLANAPGTLGATDRGHKASLCPLFYPDPAPHSLPVAERAAGRQNDLQYGFVNCTLAVVGSRSWLAIV